MRRSKEIGTHFDYFTETRNLRGKGWCKGILGHDFLAIQASQMQECIASCATDVHILNTTRCAIKFMDCHMHKSHEANTKAYPEHNVF